MFISNASSPFARVNRKMRGYVNSLTKPTCSSCSGLRTQCTPSRCDKNGSTPLLLTGPISSGQPIGSNRCHVPPTRSFRRNRWGNSTSTLSTPLDIAAGTARRRPESPPKTTTTDGAPRMLGNPAPELRHRSSALNVAEPILGTQAFAPSVDLIYQWQAQNVRERPPQASATRPREQPSVAYTPPMASEPRHGPPQHADAPKGSTSRTWIALIVVFILIGAILAFLVWRNQPANPVGFERGASDMRSIRQAVATDRCSS